MCKFFKVTDVNFCQFLDENWTKVISQFLVINEIPSIIQNKLQGAKK
jgi:hypothetical protein